MANTFEEQERDRREHNVLRDLVRLREALQSAGLSGDYRITVSKADETRLKRFKACVVHYERYASAEYHREHKDGVRAEVAPRIVWELSGVPFDVKDDR